MLIALAVRDSETQSGTRLVAFAVCLVVPLGCSGSTEGRDAAPRSEVPPAPWARADASTGRAPDTAPGFAGDVHSLELERSTSVRLGPDSSAKRLGIVAAYTRVAYHETASGGGCEGRWVAIEPLGWVCEDNLRSSKKYPHGVELPRLERGEIVPGVYGKVIEEGAVTFRRDGEGLVEARPLAGSVNVRKYGELTVEDALYWKIGSDEYLPAAALREQTPSAWHGVRLGDETGLSLPIGFAANRDNLNHRVSTYRRAAGGGAVRKLEPRAVVPVLEVARDDRGKTLAYRIGAREWVRERDMRYVAVAEPPPFTDPLERWIDVDLYRQVLVAYEGELPVYATLISSGSSKHPTPAGIYRVWVKFAETDMSGEMADDVSYSVATVPWTQFFAKDLALHTAYWHDKFGRRRSHGCINLAPIDSRFLYFWSEPEVPPGWSMSHGVLERPGSMVRVRSREEPDPQFVGYAKEVYELRKRRDEKR